MKTLKGRKFFFATRNDLIPGLRSIEESMPVDYVLLHDTGFTLIPRLSEHSLLGQTTGRDVNTSPIYLIFRRGEVPPHIRQPTSDCVIVRAGGLRAASGVLIAGELQQPVSPSAAAQELFSVVARELFRGFERVKLYLVGPEALAGLRAGQRLATISLGSPPEYDLTEQ